MKHRTGLMGLVSWYVIGAIVLYVAAMPASVLAAGLAKEEIRELERLLDRFGFDPGPVDGVMDGGTKTAIEGYQRMAMLPVNGLPSQPLLDELRDVVAVHGQRVATAAEPRVRTTTKASAKADSPAKSQVAAAPESPAASTGTGVRYAVHLASLRDEIAAREEWGRLQAAFPNHLRDKELILRPVDLADQGKFVRVLAGSFEDRADAKKLCQSVMSSGQYCIVQRAASGT